MNQWIEVNLKALASNAKEIRKRLNKASFMAVVKADAYGHGAVQVAETLIQGNLCNALGVWSLDEAEKILSGLPIDCRKRIPFALLAPAMEDVEKLEWGVRHDVWFNVDDTSSLTRIAGAAGLAKKKAKVFLDVDSGLGRWGVPVEGLPALTRRAASYDSVEIMGISTHLDYVSGLLKTEGENKLSRFLAAVKETESKMKRTFTASCANTSVFLDFPDWHLDLVRIGNLLYGVNPTKTAFPVKNIWSFKAKVAGVRQVERGEVVGYAGEYLAPKPMRVATVLCGFADGLTMEPAHRFIRLSGPPAYYAKSGEIKLPLLGRPGFGHVLVDATAAPKLKAGDAVELPVRRTAAPSRIPRIYK